MLAATVTWAWAEIAWFGVNVTWVCALSLPRSPPGYEVADAFRNNVCLPALQKFNCAVTE